MHLKCTPPPFRFLNTPLGNLPLRCLRELYNRKWPPIGMSWWYRGALCGHLLPAIANIGPAVQRDRYIPLPQSARPSAPSATNFPSRWGQEAEFAWIYSRLAACSRLLWRIKGSTELYCLFTTAGSIVQCWRHWYHQAHCSLIRKPAVPRDWL